ncbi:hypothetical protein CU102_22770 [Phyllobacterium brassicacearum]|uniref:Uncharacterized protein n=1 Tax=Phyllobacterium brassicacearum TaxID=314235 RepID=A0A2P7BBJ8_9HYPH|nr:hypothetical protein CU102_22770 [Phyllobacterium brassicacearum]
MNPFCFADGETIHAEGGELDVVHRVKPPDKVGGRQPETRRWPGQFAPNPSVFGFVRWMNIGLAKPLDLEPNSLEQDDSIWLQTALMAQLLATICNSRPASYISVTEGVRSAAIWGIIGPA